jgi:4,5-DOPA dioxygenase extradiol
MTAEYRQSLFIGHGSPMNAISSNSYTQFLHEYSKSIKPPSAIIVISAHWQTRGTYITGSKRLSQIYDFYGFPEELYNIKYTPPGSPEMARQIGSDDIGIKVDERRGIDHAAWAVVMHMYPEENIPLLEISLDKDKSIEEHFKLAGELNKYRKENVLFIGSGNIVHNLMVIDFDADAKPYDWAVSTDKWFKERITACDIQQLLHYDSYLPDYKLAVPTDEHYLPFIYTLGMKLPGEEIKTLHESIQNGSISMRSIEISGA